MDARRKRLIDSREAGKVGRRYYAFYRGFQARRTSAAGNPFKPGTEDHKILAVRLGVRRPGGET